ncbi:hypothetical protein, conserved [Trypanosoma brucei gambiense DAL972]|uniref:F-box domain-containing protein n=1 Tax=Trypanosoma brucei gambiense (strain MHOM/CI/86/DAL972) TaxID=679716 RepID=C9ZI36_TRYB9|nr:hypothetical protein, conserved [Trypanosoma brucei gambiense DAL972]CBH09153.1 hypothetical protein, conserved [Trypanosoma brucei gambiense DAL972]|eukprot:XP_011771594.1 hypothetical protein, conserved [Trypanosoma brucei gambiense DAL972]
MFLKEGNSEMRLSGATFLKGAVDDFNACESPVLSSGSSLVLTSPALSTSDTCRSVMRETVPSVCTGTGLSSRCSTDCTVLKCVNPLHVKFQEPSGLSGADSVDSFDSLGDLSELHEEHQHVSSVASEKPLTLHDVPESVLYGAIPYLSLPDVIALSRTCKKFHKLVQGYFAVNEHGVMSIPAFDTRSFMQYRPERKPPVTKALSMEPATKASDVKPIRLFFGQQRRDPHPSALRRLLRFIAPDLVIAHMEAHTNPVDGRGKGCAWVFALSQLDAERLLRLSGRIFLDINSNGEEVYLFAPPNCREWLNEHAECAVASAVRPSHLPRQPMVVEAPRKSSAKVEKGLEQCVRPHPQHRGVTEQQAPVAAAQQMPDSVEPLVRVGSPQDEGLQQQERPSEAWTTSNHLQGDSTHGRRRSGEALQSGESTPERLQARRRPWLVAADASATQRARELRFCSNSSTFLHHEMWGFHPGARLGSGVGGDRFIACPETTTRTVPHNVYTSTIWTGPRRFRHDPYVYGPLCVLAAS